MDINDILNALVVMLGMVLCAACIVYLEEEHEQAVRDTLTISESCLKNDFMVIDNSCEKSCHVFMDCYGDVNNILIMGNRFTCNGSMNIVFENASKIHMKDNIIAYDLKFQDIDKFVFGDTQNKDNIIIRGSDMINNSECPDGLSVIRIDKSGITCGDRSVRYRGKYL